jgi:CRISPR system Cascade subunit CasA
VSQFNLIDEPWIPVRFPDGRREELGIRDTVQQSRDIAAIEDPSPLVVAALHRFLLSILYRALEGPTDVEQAHSLFQEGIPAESVVAYLERWRNRFWLVDERYPFHQVPDYQPTEWKTWLVLAAEHNADNAKVLWDHTEIAQAGSIPPSPAARWLIACQTFALAGGNSDFQYRKDAPSATAVMSLPMGLNLHDTLVFSLVPQNREVTAADRPIWEREPDSAKGLKEGIERSAAGAADLFTWRTRSVRLRANELGSIDAVGFASGVSESPNGVSDPMLAYRVDEKLGRRPMQFRARGLWRDFDSLLPDGSGLAPTVIVHASVLARRDPKRRPRSVVALGQASKKAKVEYWRAERFAFPDTLAADGLLRAEIRELLTEAEVTQRALWSASRSFARDLLSRGDRDPAKEDVSSFLEQMPVIGCYWSILESRFHDLLRGYTADRDREDIRHEWLLAVRDAATQAWHEHATSVAIGDAWTIRALVRAEKLVHRKLAALKAEIQALEPKTEAA